MKEDTIPAAVQIIPVEHIAVANPRVRIQRIFKGIVENIAELGLKRPITVRRRPSAEGMRYDLICGQGRLEAFQALGQQEIPAFVTDADSETGMVMSLVENLARRQHRAIDLLHDIEGMKRRGYGETEIARKTGLTLDYVKGVIRLIEGGEDRLLRAVESGHVPVSIAVEIAETDDAEVQNVLEQAYESKALWGRKLMVVKRLIAQRRRRGKTLDSGGRRRSRPLSVEALVRTYQQETEKKPLLVQKAETTRDRLIFVTEALRKLFDDEHFVTLLRAEGLDSLPRSLGDRIQPGLRN
jgi:ParB family chromosome partitioning protein